MADSGIFIRFISHSLEYMCLIKASNMLVLLYQDVIDVMDQCDILWAVQATKTSSDYIMTEDNTVNICKANIVINFMLKQSISLS